LGIAIASVWFDEIAAGRAQTSTFTGDLLGILALCLAMMLLPYLVLTPRLVRARERGTVEYGELTHRYAAQFEQRWLDRSAHERADMLGHPDISALADIRTITDGVERMHVVVPSGDNLKSVLIGAALPFLLVALAHGPSAAQLLRSAVVRFIGG
jgi:hypothetical protein